MKLPDPKLLPIAIRVYPEIETDRDHQTKRHPPTRPDAMLVFDCETRTDATQRLTFGSYRFLVNGNCLEEGLFYADDLPPHDRRVIERYVATHPADVGENGNPQLQLLTRQEFVNSLFNDTYRTRALLVGFNLPFDLSRVAFDFTSARGRFTGGFSLGLWSFRDKEGCERQHPYRPRVGIKHMDSKRALKGFTARQEPDRVDLIPEGSKTGIPEQGYKFRGHFLDLRTLAFALTDRGYSLGSGCKAFGVEHGKEHVDHHGEITAEYIDYNRRDVLATAELATKTLEEYDKHPIQLQVTKAYSPASIGKAYLEAMGVNPILERQPDFPKEYLGFAQSAFFGGRTSAHIRKTPVPVVYTDFLSMYPTVNSLMGLWRFVIAREIKIIEHCNSEIEEFLGKLSRDSLFTQETWKNLTAFVRVIPDRDILPSRSKYSLESNDWQVAVNYISANSCDPRNAIWFSLPDVVTSVMLTGHIPKIIDAYRLEAGGILPGLQPVALRGNIEVNPRHQDFFKVVIEERKRSALRTDISQVERERLNNALKVLANATSYGIYAEMIRQESDEEVKVTCHGIDAKSYRCRVTHPEAPGKYCFPPLAALITGAARLMLALLESCVSELGGTYAMEDTDSMAIVATKRGGTIPCPGGPLRTNGGLSAINALSWEQVGNIVQKFTALNPYDRSAIPGSILKVEDNNFDPQGRKQRQLYCFAISAKRYALFVQDKQRNPALLRTGINSGDDGWKEHGLGHLLNPTDPESEDRQWIGQAWLDMIRRTLGLPTVERAFEDRPAVGRISVSSPAIMRPLIALNKDKKYADQIKPFNFLLNCHIKQMGHPTDADPQRFHLIAPYETNPAYWLKRPWIDQYSGKLYRITTSGHHGARETARVKTYGEVLREYEFHPEAKCADANGNACERQTVGLLQRRHIRIEQIKYIGKESNSLEEVDSGLLHSEDSVYTEYPDPQRDEWQTEILPALQKMSLAALVEKCRGEISRRALIDLRAGRSRPHRKNQQFLETIRLRLPPSAAEVKESFARPPCARQRREKTGDKKPLPTVRRSNDMKNSALIEDVIP